MDIPVGFGNIIRIKDPVKGAILEGFWRDAANQQRINWTVNDDVSNLYGTNGGLNLVDQRHYLRFISCITTVTN